MFFHVSDCKLMQHFSFSAFGFTVYMKSHENISAIGIVSTTQHVVGKT